MIVAWEPLEEGEPWHLSLSGDQVALCGGKLVGFIRPQDSIDRLEGRPCPECWREGRLVEGAIASQEQGRLVDV